MITFVSGDFFANKYDVLVNTVNAVGVMGKGIALEFKDRFPSMFFQYKMDCLNELVKAGSIKVYEENGQTIVNFATKDHWKNPSEYTWIESGLKELHDWLASKPSTTTIAIPALGCSNGGLEWAKVKAMIESSLQDLPHNIMVFSPL